MDSGNPSDLSDLNLSLEFPMVQRLIKVKPSVRERNGGLVEPVLLL